jgi:hypothetical protein
MGNSYSTRTSRSAALEGPPAAFTADLRLVEGLLSERKPHNDFRGLLSIGRAPQIKIGNDVVESL